MWPTVIPQFRFDLLPFYVQYGELFITPYVVKY